MMAAIGHLVVRLVWIATGLAAACLAAGLFFGFGFTMEFVDPAMTDAAGWHGLLAAAAGFVWSPFNAKAALGPALLMIAVAEVARLRGFIVNLLLGGAVAVTGFSLQVETPGLQNLREGTLLVLLAAGFVAGAAYWLVAGRSAGVWLEGPRHGHTGSRRARSEGS